MEKKASVVDMMAVKMESKISDAATIHGQSGQLRLSSPDRQRDLLDAHARPPQLARYRLAYAERRD